MASAPLTRGALGSIAPETRLKLYRSMLECRYLEKRAYDLFMQNLIKGTSHLALGQEAIAAGVRTRDAAGRLHVLHLPRPQPHARPRRRR